MQAKKELSQLREHFTAWEDFEYLSYEIIYKIVRRFDGELIWERGLLESHSFFFLEKT